MPEIDGKTVLRNIRSSIRDNNISVIIFSAVDDVNKRVELLNLGANDFFNKCGSIDELVARINVQCRNDILIEAKQDNCKIDIMNKSLLLFGKEIKMTLTELQIVNLLINNKSRYVSRDTFQKRIYNYYESDIYHPFDAAIHRIRTKVKKYTDKDLILSHRNKGWKLNYDLINITKK